MTKQEKDKILLRYVSSGYDAGIVSQEFGIRPTSVEKLWSKVSVSERSIYQSEGEDISVAVMESTRELQEKYVSRLLDIRNEAIDKLHTLISNIGDSDTDCLRDVLECLKQTHEIIKDIEGVSTADDSFFDDIRRRCGIQVNNINLTQINNGIKR